MNGAAGNLRRWLRRLLQAVRYLLHLGARFLGSISPRPPSPADEVWADCHLSEAERHLWRQLGNRDRRHCISVARRFASPGRKRAEIAGALLHDIGKIESDLGIPGRIVATVIGPRTERLRTYLDHEQRGVELLKEVGSDPVTVQLVAGSGSSAEALRSADDAVVAQLLRKPIAE
jgi:hypothetical protein